MRRKGASPDREIAGLAARQHGVVSLRQLSEAGMSSAGVSRRVKAGRLHRVHRGVYAVGYEAPTPERRWMAATFAYGKGACVSHRSAAVLWGLLKPADGPVDITVRGTGGRKPRQGVRLHRSGTLASSEATLRRGIPVTTVARTISDLRQAASARELRRAIRQAGVLGLPLGPGVKRDRTRSDLERDFLRLCRRYRLSPPEVNVRVGPCLADFLWRERRLIVETDGYQYHRGRQAHRDDRARDLALRARGFDVVRLSEDQIDEQPRQVAEALRKMLAASRP